MSMNDRRAAYGEAEFQADLVRKELLAMFKALQRRVAELEKQLAALKAS